MSLTLLEPAWLWGWLLLPLLALVRTRVRVPGQLALRIAIGALLFLALARPAWWSADAREHAVLVVDGSASVDPAARERVIAAVLDARERFSDDVVDRVVWVGDEGTRFGDRRAQDLTLRPTGSPSTALHAALRSIPADARGSVTWITDGRATDPWFGAALMELQERALPLHVVPTAAAPLPARIAALRSPSCVRVGERATMDVDAVGPGEVVRVEVFVADERIASLDVPLEREAGTATFAWEPRETGFVEVVARCEGHELRTTVAVDDPLRVLYVGERVTGARDALGRLLGRGFVLETASASDAAPIPDLERDDLVVLDDVPAASLSPEFQRALATAVFERGLGLVVCGGEASFGPGGYRDSALDALLPVEAIQKEEKRDPSTTLVLIIDTSGSMGGERIQLAKEVARLAMGRLLPHDKVGIVEFYGAKRWAAPIQPASNAIDLARALNRMDAGGGTVILPAIEEAFYGMQNVQTRYKHVLVLTDGGVESGSFEPLLRRMADEGITTSTVLIGPEAHSEFLVDLANWGKGRFYAVPDRFNLPEILLKQPTSSRLPAYKPGSFALTTRGGRGFWGDVDPRSAPPIAGYVETTARPGSETLIAIDGEGDPLLSTWIHGLGRVTTFTSEPTGPGTAPWRAWDGYGPLFARVFARTADESRPPFAFTLERRGAQLELTARRTRPGTTRPRAVQVDGATELELEFVATSHDVEFATLLVPPTTPVRVVAGADGDPAMTRLVSNARADERDELAVPARAAVDLERFAAVTGGDVVDASGLARYVPRAGGSAPPPRLVEWAPWMFGLALVLYLFDVFHRRRDRGAATAGA
ncbi:MAG: VWA domain-containing protein [Planctomycetes bacterium]|nr:VWA domain-containing protein [Planctomycetota bacterium]